MRKKEIIKLLKVHLEQMTLQALENLLDSWEEKTPKLWKSDSQTGKIKSNSAII